MKIFTSRRRVTKGPNFVKKWHQSFVLSRSDVNSFSTISLERRTSDTFSTIPGETDEKLRCAHKDDSKQRIFRQRMSRENGDVRTLPRPESTWRRLGLRICHQARRFRLAQLLSRSDLCSKKIEMTYTNNMCVNIEMASAPHASQFA